MAFSKKPEVTGSQKQTSSVTSWTQCQVRNRKRNVPFSISAMFLMALLMSCEPEIIRFEMDAGCDYLAKTNDECPGTDCTVKLSLRFLQYIFFCNVQYQSIVTYSFFFTFYNIYILFKIMK